MSEDDRTKWLESEFENVRSLAQEAKEIALRARKHECIQKDRMGAWDRWWRGIVVTIFAGILGAVGFAWRMNDRAAVLEHGVADLGVAVDDMTAKVETVSADQKRLQGTLNENAETKPDEAKRLKKIFLDALSEFDVAPRRRNR